LSVRRWFCRHQIEIVEKPFNLPQLGFGAGQAILKHDDFLDWIFASIQLAGIGNNGWSETFRDVQGFGGFSRLPLTLNWGTGAFAAPLFSRGQFAVLFLFASHTSR
jgi:hypothetical protein